MEVRLLKFLFTLLLLPLGMSLIGGAQAASMTFTPSSTAFKMQCSSRIDLVVDTQGVSTNAVDAVILFNPNEVQILDQNSSMSGIQIAPGNIYEIYAGNSVNEAQGRILLTAFSVMDHLNGSGLLASLYFNSKPGVTSTTFQFEFSPGESTDSNVADTNGNDVLSSVNSGSYTFQSSPCVSDTQAPSVSQLTPANSSTGVPLDTDISLHITDNQSGVDLSTVEIQIHDVIYTSSTPETHLTGLPLDYIFHIDPANDFPADTEITLVIKATDVDGNVMSPKVYSFNRPVPPPPLPVCGNNIVEEGEACEPPGNFTCNSTCQFDPLVCLSVDPVLLEQLAVEAVTSGTLDPATVGSISDLKTLNQVIRGESSEEHVYQLGASFNDAVETLTKSSQTIVQSLGCTDNCITLLYGEDSQRWYIPFALLLVLLLLLVLVIYRLARKLQEKSQKALEEQKPKKRLKK